MDRYQWYKPNLLYNIHWRPPIDNGTANQEHTVTTKPKMVVLTKEFNPSICTCGEHQERKQYRMEREVVWTERGKMADNVGKHTGRRLKEPTDDESDDQESNSDDEEGKRDEEEGDSEESDSADEEGNSDDEESDSADEEGDSDNEGDSVDEEDDDNEENDDTDQEEEVDEDNGEVLDTKCADDISRLISEMSIDDLADVVGTVCGGRESFVTAVQQWKQREDETNGVVEKVREEVTEDVCSDVDEDEKFGSAFGIMAVYCHSEVRPFGSVASKIG